MAQHIHNDARIHAFCDQQCSAAMPQVVQAHTGQTSSLQERLEFARQVARVDWRAMWRAEYKIHIKTRGASWCSLLSPSLPVAQ